MDFLWVSSHFFLQFSVFISMESAYKLESGWRNISFSIIGSCYYVFPGAAHNRFEHSIGCVEKFLQSHSCLICQLSVSNSTFSSFVPKSQPLDILYFIDPFLQSLLLGWEIMSNIEETTRCWCYRRGHTLCKNCRIMSWLGWVDQTWNGASFNNLFLFMNRFCDHFVTS